jgi:uncharacterized protein (TIGR03437 family)
LMGANPLARIEGVEELSGKSHYMVGADQTRWRTNIPNYSKVRYAQAWPGIDVVWYGNQRRLEYDFVVAPGANPRAIKLSIDGAEKIRIDKNGDLILRLGARELRQHKPIVYQDVNGDRRAIRSGYALKGNQVEFETGDYDRSRELVIDPALNYLARLNIGRSIAVDREGNAYITASTSTDLNPADILVTKLNPTGTQRLYTVMIGGISVDTPYDLAVDAAGSVYLTGQTASTDFPGTYPGASSGASAGVCYKTTDGAVNWNNSGKGLPASSMIALVIDPNNPMSLYAEVGAVSMNSAVYKSSDAGKNWIRVDVGIVTRARPLAVAPGNSNIIFVGTSSGLRKSVDGGASWTESGLNVADVSALIIDPKNPLNCYAGTPLGIYKSIDGGSNWNTFNTGLPTPFRVEQLASNSVTTSTIYARGLNAGNIGRLYRTTNGAATWEDVTPGKGIDALAVDPINSSAVYAGSDSGLLKSIDGGKTWQPTGLDGQGVLLMAIDPTNPATLYAYTVSPYMATPSEPQGGFIFSVLKSVNGGASWIAFNNLLKQKGLGRLTLAIDPLNSATIYAGAGGNNEAFVLKLNPAGDGIVYSTLLGGAGSETGVSIAVDRVGSAYVTGRYGSSPRNFAKNGLLAESGLGFMAKLNPQGTEIVYSTLLQGEGAAIAVDEAGKSYVAENFFVTIPPLPVKNGFQTAPRGEQDILVLKIDPDKSGNDSLLYSTYLGGSSTDLVRAIAVDSGGRIYVAGNTFSTDFPITPNTLRSQLSGCFITRIDPMKTGQSSLLWSTNFQASEIGGIVVDSQNNLYVTGAADTNFAPTPGALQSSISGCITIPCNCPLVKGSCLARCQIGPGTTAPCSDAFVSKIRNDGAALLYSTYLGSSANNEAANDIALDATGAVYLTGATDLPATDGAFQSNDANKGGFIAKLTLDSRNTMATTVSAASYFGPQVAVESLAVGFLDAFGSGSENLKVAVIDGAGVEKDAQVFFSGFGQVNFQIPQGMAIGDALIRVVGSGAVIANGPIQVVNVAPGVFSADSGGGGLAAAIAQRARQDGTVTYEAIYRIDPAQGKPVAIPIDLSSENDQMFLVIFGTGWRFRSAVSEVKVTIGGVDVPVLYAGSQLTFDGLDQINVRLPRTLAGKGNVDLAVMVDGKVSNTTQLNVK